MNHYVSVPATIVVTNPNAIVRAVACASVLNLPVMTGGQLRWIESQTEPYEYGTQFWVPYGQFRRAFYMKPWAIATLNYLSGKSLSPEDLARIDPASFYSDIKAQVKKIDPIDSLAATAREAYWLGSVKGAIEENDESWEETLGMLYAEVQVAAANGHLMTNPRRIKRMLSP